MSEKPIRLAFGRALTASPRLWRLSVTLYNKRVRFRNLQQQHPFDREYGIDTGGAIPGWLLGSGSDNDRHIKAYSGCQPSCLRAALSFLADEIGGATFVDLGCGKGRAMIVASEFPFASIVGVEMSPGLCEVARRNAKSLRSRKQIQITPHVICGDAQSFHFPNGALAVFLYHSFGLPVLKGVLDALEAIPQSQDMFFIYENPVYGDELDRRPGFQRWFARAVPTDLEESPFRSGAREGETIVVWRRPISPRVSADDGARRRIVIQEEGWRASLL